MFDCEDSDDDDNDVNYTPNEEEVSEDSSSDVEPNSLAENTEKNTEINPQKANDIWKSFLDEVSEEKEESFLEKSSENVEAEVPAKDKGETVLEFAGEIINIDKDDSRTNKGSVSATSPVSGNSNSGIKRRKGLTSILSSITTKKQKINTLEKSLLDWKQYKKEEDIEDELAVYNRGKNGYIERQRFLERSDLRSYEIERDARLSKRNKSSNI